MNEQQKKQRVIELQYSLKLLSEHILDELKQREDLNELQEVFRLQKQVVNELMTLEQN